jgi:tRNA pseudouridine38-40 synthase
MRIKAIVSYDGGFFQGFQKQTNNNLTITSAIESALRSLHIDGNIVGSGRTDAGVHASGQVIHFDLPHFWNDMAKLRYELNRKLKHIYIKHITQADPNFHARFWAKRRIYRYIFKQKKPSLFEEKYVAHYSSFDPSKLQDAIEAFEGEHDFCYFCKTGSNNHNTKRRVFTTRYKQFGDYHILYFEANGFLRGQVRMMIGAAMKCASGDITLQILAEQINGTHCHVISLAPASGLY